MKWLDTALELRVFIVSLGGHPSCTQEAYNLGSKSQISHRYASNLCFLFSRNKMRENITIFLNETDRDFGNMSGECLHEYTGSHCLNVLKSYSDCESPARATADVYVSNSVRHQKGVENLVDSFLFALDLYINPSDECRKAVIPLLCLYYFGLCGTHNTDYRPTAAQCREVRDSTCQSEWKTAEKLLELSAQQFMLLDCSGLNDEGLECNEGLLK